MSLVLFELLVDGDQTTPSTLKIKLGTSSHFAMRLRLCNGGTYDESTNGTIAISAASANLIKSHSVGKDIEVESLALNGDEIWIDITNAIPDAMTLRIGPPEVGSLALDYSASYDLTHTGLGERELETEEGEFVLSGSAATLTKRAELICDTRKFGLLADDVEFTYSGAVISPT